MEMCPTCGAPGALSAVISAQAARGHAVSRAWLARSVGPDLPGAARRGVPHAVCSSGVWAALGATPPCSRRARPQGRVAGARATRSEQRDRVVRGPRRCWRNGRGITLHVDGELVDVERWESAGEELTEALEADTTFYPDDQGYETLDELMRAVYAYGDQRRTRLRPGRRVRSLHLQRLPRGRARSVRAAPEDRQPRVRARGADLGRALSRQVGEHGRLHRFGIAGIPAAT